MSKDMIVVRSAPRVDKKEGVRVRNPVLLGIVVSKVRTIIEGPTLRLTVVQAVIADRHIAVIVISHRQEKTVTKLRDRRLVEAAFDRNRQLAAVFEISHVLTIKVASQYSHRVVRRFESFEVDRKKDVSVRQIRPLDTTSSSIFELGFVGEFD